MIFRDFQFLFFIVTKPVDVVLLLFYGKTLKDPHIFFKIEHGSQMFFFVYFLWFNMVGIHQSIGGC